MEFVGIKRKPAPLPQRPNPARDNEVVAPEILEQAKQSILAAKGTARSSKCSVCNAECAPNSTEGLCWVCRRLKISAWRDSDQQAPVQE